MDNKNKRRAVHLFSIFANQKHLKVPETIEDFKKLPSSIPSFPFPFVKIAGLDLYHDDEGYRAYRQFLEIFSSDKDIARHFTPASLSATAKKYIILYIEDGLQGHPKGITGSDAIENILSELSSPPDEIEVHFLVNGLLLDDMDSIRLGKLTFGKIDFPYVEKLFPTIDFSKRDEKSICPPPSKDRQLEIEAGILAKRKSLFGLTMAKVVGRGDIWRSRQEAYRECKITLGALSIYPIIFTYESNRRQMIRNAFTVDSGWSC